MKSRCYGTLTGMMALLGLFLAGCKATVPDVVGQPRATAESMITDTGLSVGAVTEAPNNEYPAGHVYEQDPGAGIKVAKETAVDLSVSTGPATGEGEGEAPVEGEGEARVEGEGEAPVEGEGESIPAWQSRALPPGIGDAAAMDICIPAPQSGWIVGMEIIETGGSEKAKGLFDEGEFDPFGEEPFWWEGEFDPFEGYELFEEGEFSPGESMEMTGFALRLTPGGWSKMTLPDLGVNWSLFSVSATGASNAWLAGGDFDPADLDLELEFDGEIEFEKEDYTGPYGAIALHDPGNGVVEINTNTAFQVVTEAAAVGAGDVRLAAPAGLQRLKDGIWTAETLPTELETLYALAFPEAEAGWAAGSATDPLSGKLRGKVMQYSAGAWTAAILPELTQPWELLDIAVTSNGEVWAAGYSSDEEALTRTGVLLHYDGATWQSEALPSVSGDWRLESLSMPETGTGWVCGTDHIGKCGVMLCLKEGSWQEEALPAPAGDNWTLTGLSMVDAFSGWAVGYDNANNVILLYEYAYE